MLSAFLLILLLVYFYREHLNRKMDRRKYVHSSYYDLAFGGDRTCGEDAEIILRKTGGYKRLIRHWRCLAPGGPAEAELILIHETGIYLVETRDYQGYISGFTDEEYWVQTRDGGLYSCNRNFFRNPLEKLREAGACLKKEFPDMKWLPVYYLAVFGDGCELENAGLSDGQTKIILLRQLSCTLYDMVRNARKFLAPQVIDEIWERLALSEDGCGQKGFERKRLDKTGDIHYSIK